MKGILIAILVVAGLHPVMAQKRFIEELPPKNSFSFGIGFFTAQELAMDNATAFSVPISDSISGGDKNPRVDMRTTGTLSFGYGNFVSETITVGFSIFYGAYDATNIYSNGKNYLYTNRYIGGLVRADWRWINERSYQLYTAAGLGVTTIQSEGYGVPKASKFAFAGQISPLGFRYGEGFGFYVELGFGSTGIVSGGVSYIF